MYDSRLIGIWKSDSRRTVQEILARRDIRGSKKSKLISLFGKLELRYTRTHCHTKLGDYRTVTRYTVVAKDSSSVATVSENRTAGKRIFHIHFEDDHYWICLGRIREYFKRVDNKGKGRKR
jgi:hypothetical protein